MTHSAAGPACDERGFILVGVVMFMVALTLLGLSLFALSSYEAQFFYASTSREQALQSSESGMEVVKALLAAPPYKLDSAQLAVGQFGITKALAYQWRSSNPNDTTSRGLVNWDSTVVIVVAARAGGEERAVQSRFVPAARKNPYQQLLSCGQRIWYNTSAGTSRTMELRGRVWQHVQTAADDAWTAYVNWPSGGPVDPSPAPTPLADAFVDSHRPLAVKPTHFDLSSSPAEIRFDVASNGPVFYRSLAPTSSGSSYPELNWYEFSTDHDMTLKIQGTVVWVVGQGVCFRKTVTVEPLVPNDPANPNVLVIVAKANLLDPGDRNRGIWFEGGLVVADPSTTRVFLVSEGDISLTQYADRSTSFDAKAISIVAGGDVELMGPNSGSTLMLEHPSAMDVIADDLLGRLILPAAGGGSDASFAYAWHSWLETHLP